MLNSIVSFFNKNIKTNENKIKELINNYDFIEVEKLNQKNVEISYENMLLLFEKRIDSKDLTKIRIENLIDICILNPKIKTKINEQINMFINELDISAKGIYKTNLNFINASVLAYCIDKGLIFDIECKKTILECTKILSFKTQSKTIRFENNDYINGFHPVYQSLMKLIIDVLEKNIKNKNDEIIEKLIDGDVLKKITNFLSKDLVSNMDNDLQLSSECKIIIKEILNLSKNLNEYDFDDKSQFKNLIDNKLPEIILAYKDVPENYRNKFKNNNNETAEDIFKNSLLEMKNIFNKKINELQNAEIEEKISKLNVQKRYLKSFG